MSRKTDSGAHDLGMDVLGASRPTSKAATVTARTTSAPAPTPKAAAVPSRANTPAPSPSPSPSRVPTSKAAAAEARAEAAAPAPTPRIAVTQARVTPPSTPTRSKVPSSKDAARDARANASKPEDAAKKAAAKANLTAQNAMLTKANAAANRAVEAGKRFMKRRPKAGAKLIAYGKKLVEKVKRDKEKLSKTIVRGLEPGWGAAVAQEAGDALLVKIVEIDAMNALVDAVDAATIVGDLVAQLDAIGRTDIANGGQKIVDRAQTLIDTYESMTLGSVTSAGRSIVSDSNRWQPAANAALAAGATAPVDETAPFDPGTAGGGGGGGSAGEETPWPEGDEAAAADSGDAGDPFAEEEVPQEEHAEAEPMSDESAFIDAASEYASEYAEQEQSADEFEFHEDESFYDSEMEMLEEEPFDESLEFTDDNEDIMPEDALGMEFKWHYLFLPHQAIVDAVEERGKGNPGTIATSAQQPVTVASKTTATQQKRMDETKRRSEELRARRAATAAMRAQENLTEEVVGNEFDMDEPADIILEQYEQQITDQPIDPMRGRASAHRGVGDYPPGGSSSGEEGGVMRPEEQIDVFGETSMQRYALRRMEQYVDEDGEEDIDDVVLGAAREVQAIEKAHAEALEQGAYSDIEIFGAQSSYSSGLDALAGAPPIRQKIQPRAGFVKGKTATGRTFLSMATNAVKKGDLKTSVKNAQDIGKQAITTAARIKTFVKKAKQKQSTKVRGAVARPSLPKPGAKKAPVRRKVTAAQMMKMADSLQKAGQKLLNNSKKLGGLVAAQQAKQTAAIKKMTKAAKLKMYSQAGAGLAQKAGAKPAANVRTSAVSAASKGGTVASSKPLGPVARGLTRMRGDGYSFNDVLGAYEEMLGESQPDPNNPGYLVDGSYDPNYDWSVWENDSSAGGGGFELTRRDYAAELEALGPMPTDAPLIPKQDYDTDPNPNEPWYDNNVYDAKALPKGVIIFDGIPDLFGGHDALVASSNRYTSFYKSPQHNRDDGFQLNKDGWQHYDADAPKGSRYQGLSGTEMDDIIQSSMSNSFGPIVGRPDNLQVRGLRAAKGVAPGLDAGLVASAKGGGFVRPITLFWFYDTAPERMKRAGNEARLRQAILDWQAKKTEIETARDNEILADQLAQEEYADLMRQQALDAARDQNRIENEQRQVQHEADVQAKADDAAAYSQSKADEAAAYQEQLAIEAEARAYERQQEIEDARMARGQETEDASLERMMRMEEEAQRRQDAYELELAQKLDQENAALADESYQPEQAEYDEEAAPNAEEQMLPEQYMEAAAEQEGGGDAFDDGNLSDYTDSEYVTEDSVLGAYFSDPQPRVRAKHRLLAKREERR